MAADGIERPHEFGSVHTLIKLQTLGGYLSAYVQALKNFRFKLHYVDAFAGTGSCTINVGGEKVEIPGSASLAVACEPGFDRIVFIEKSQQKVRELERLKAATRNRDITIVNDDANIALPQYVRRLGPMDRAIAFLDPYGMSVHWETLKLIAASRVVDVWYLFPLSGLYRQATLHASDIDADKAAALTRLLGTEEWRQAFYRPGRQDNLFGEATSDERNADIPEMLAWVKRRLQTIFAGVTDPKVLHQVTASGKQGAPLFALFFAVSNPSEKARALAMRIAGSLLKD